MSRARTLADYVCSGDELALKAPIAGPTFTGTVAIPNVANLETAVVANTAKVTNSTNASDLASGTVAVARGGTGVTTSTGTGNVVLSSSPTLVTPALGTPASGDLSTLFPMTSSSAAGSQNIGDLRIQWGTGTTPASTTDGGTTYGLSNKHYSSDTITYGAGFAEQPYACLTIQSMEHHDAKAIVGSFNYSATNFYWYNTCSRASGITSNTYHWLVIGKAS